MRHFFIACALLLGAVMPASAQVVATDNFNRADGGLGVNWTTTTPSAVVIFSNIAVVSTPDTDTNGSHWTANTFNNDQYAQVQVAGDRIYAGPTCRATTGSNYYAVAVDYYEAPSYEIVIIKSVSNVITILHGTGVTAAANDTIKIECEGTTIRAYKNGTLAGSTTDTSFASGSAGLIVWRESGFSSSADNWEGGNLSGGGGGGAVGSRISLTGAGK